MYKKCSWLDSKSAVSPAISTVIVTGVIVGLVTIALAFASNFLIFRMAESEFNSAKQFMETCARQVDDVAWVVGRTETSRYSSRYGEITFLTALNYTISVTLADNITNLQLFTNLTGILSFNMPVSQHSIGAGYHDLIYPSYGTGFMLDGTSSPVTKVFAVENLPMADGSYLRVVLIPAIRMISLTMGDTNYLRLYLPILSKGATPGYSQSVTMTGETVTRISENITAIKVVASFPLQLEGFDNTFFKLSQTEESISCTNGTILELYVSEVDVGLGVHA